jgi:eukaryotic-like serine/threonine-protein kinase
VEPEGLRRIEEAYHRALEVDESRRSEFLKEFCAGDETLRREVESLLAHEKQAEHFIESSALKVVSKQVASQLRARESETSLVGRTVSHYHIIEKLGDGGMGVVYKAEDTRLHRFVALKFLPEHFAHDPQWLSRFRREAQAASALNHPNICTIYDVGEYEGNAFIAMEFLDGQTLRHIIGGGPSTEQVLDLGIQIADALEAAHSHGIVHRDVKPANIFVSKQGHVKLLDFGVAKLSRDFAAHDQADAEPQSPSGEEHPTRPGVAIGTAAYMSPEQVRGEDLDGRSDIFSFGVVLFEMATGIHPFRGNTSGAISGAILYQTPMGPSLSNSQLSPKLDEIIAKALQKDRDLRYQHAANLGADLRRLRRDPENSQSRARVAPKRILWKIAAVALLVIAVVGSALVYYFHSQHPLTERDTVVLADFNNQTTDPIFSDTLKQAFSTELGQSPFLNVMSDRKINETLQMMRRPSGDRITLDVGREICQRNGAKALLNGTISSLGSVYLISLNAVACSTGENLAEEQAEAGSKEDVLKALSQASSRLRIRLGESLPSVQKYETPVEATTSSLEALQNYSLGLKVKNEKGNVASIPFLKRAVELDPNFPMAYAALSVAYSNTYQPSLAVEYASKAYQLRDRVTEREKMRISATYFGSLGEEEKTIQAYQEWIAVYPRDPMPHLNLGGTYHHIGQNERALSEIKQALELMPDYRAYYGNLLFSYLLLNRFDEAQATFDQALARGMDSGDLRIQMYALAFVRGDTKAMAEQLAWFAGKPGEEDALLSTQSDTEAYYGRMRRAREFSRRAVDSALRAGSKEAAALWEVNAALREAEIGENTAARKGVTSALSLSRDKTVKIVAALALARVGDPKAEALAKELANEYPTNGLLKLYWLPTIRASLEMKRENSAESLRQLADAKSYELGTAGMFVNYLYPGYVRGQAFLLAHNGIGAAAEFQKLLDHPGLMQNFVTGSIAHLQIGRAYAKAGDAAKAKAAYRDFFNLWKDADPDVPILKEAKTEYGNLH